MKRAFLLQWAGVCVLLVLMTACSNHKSEKKIAALEARIAELEGKNNQTLTPTDTPEEKPDGPLPVFQFSDMDFDFGNITEGDQVEHKFAFKNVGEAPLIIQDAKPSCGCTVPDWTKDPVPVGGEGFIRVKFDSKGKSNVQNKTVTVTANTWPKQTTLRFKAMVNPR